MTRIIANPVVTKNRSNKISDKFGVFKKMNVNDIDMTSEQILESYMTISREHHQEIDRKQKSLRDSCGRDLVIHYFNCDNGNDKIRLIG